MNDAELIKYLRQTNETLTGRVEKLSLTNKKLRSELDNKTKSTELWRDKFQKLKTRISDLSKNLNEGDNND